MSKVNTIATTILNLMVGNVAVSLDIVKFWVNRVTQKGTPKDGVYPFEPEREMIHATGNAEKQLTPETLTRIYEFKKGDVPRLSFEMFFVLGLNIGGIRQYEGDDLMVYTTEGGWKLDKGSSHFCKLAMMMIMREHKEEIKKGLEGFIAHKPNPEDELGIFQVETPETPAMPEVEEIEVEAETTKEVDFNE